MKSVEKSEKYVIYFGGGTMTGIFGVGVANVLQKNNFYDSLEVVYGASAGVLTGACFLSRQTNMGLPIYTEELNENFVMVEKGFVNAWIIFKNRFIKPVPKENFINALNIEHLMKVIKHHKPLRVERITDGHIPLYVKLFNMDTHKVEYIDARREEIFDVLEAGISVFPYVNKVIEIGGKRYIDGAIMDVIGAKQLKQKHPKEKIVVVMNRTPFPKLQYRAKNILEGKFMEWLFREKKFYNLYATAEDRLAEDLKLIKSDPQFILICPDRDIGMKSRTTDKTMLTKLHDLGTKQGEKFLKEINRVD